MAVEACSCCKGANGKNLNKKSELTTISPIFHVSIAYELQDPHKSPGLLDYVDLKVVHFKFRTA